MRCARRATGASIVLIAIILAGTARAGVVHVGTFENLGQGRIEYTGDYDAFITSSRQGNTGQYTVVHIDLTGLLDSIDVAAFIGVTAIDHGDNIYTGAPGADIDYFRMTGLDAERAITWLYDGPTSVHQNETSAQLGSRVALLDWGARGGQLSSGEFVSLGQFGRLTAQLDSAQYLDPGNGGGSLLPIVLDISEAGNSERFDLEIETVEVPAPGAAVLLGLAAMMGRRRRRH